MWTEQKHRNTGSVQKGFPSLLSAEAVKAFGPHGS